MPERAALFVPAQSTTNWVEVDLSAVRHNVEEIGRQVEPAGVAAVVKADGYGHGAIVVSQAALAAGASRLCVFSMAEAAQLRQAGIDAPILSMGPLLDSDPERAARLDVAVVVDSMATARRLASVAGILRRRIAVHINLDSGMQRYGRSHAEAATLADAIGARAELQLEAVFTHFPDAGNPDPADTLNSLRTFQETAERLGAPLRHAAASAAIFHIPGARLDFVRAGIALYGVDPTPELPHSTADGLRPVLSWRTSLLAIRELSRGQSVSYGGRWSAGRDSRIGVIGAGYADGLRRALSPGGYVLARGQRAPLRGTICMDSAMIDLTDIPQASIGDVVTIIGRDGDETIHAWDLAHRLDTIPYEILANIAARVPRRVLQSAMDELDEPGA